jgi:hypothetical protein
MCTRLPSLKQRQTMCPSVQGFEDGKSLATALPTGTYLGVGAGLGDGPVGGLQQYSFFFFAAGATGVLVTTIGSERPERLPPRVALPVVFFAMSALDSG